MSNDVSKKSERIIIRQKETKSLTVKDMVHFLQFNALPVFIFIFFLCMAFFFTIPHIGNMVNKLQMINKLSEEVSRKDKILRDLNQLRQQQTLDVDLLKNIDTLVPTESTRVAEFKEKLSQIASECGLIVVSIRAGEIIRGIEDQPFENPNNLPLHLIEIPTTLEARGQMNQFKEFLTKLFEAKDFFVVEEMTIKKSSQDQMWLANLIIVKYQFGGKVTLPEDIEPLVNLTPVQGVIDFINSKFTQ